jgi:hypothetical protein
MKNTFTVNNKEYEAKAFDFNMVCDLEDMGVPMQDLGNKQTKAIRSYFAICGNMTAEEAGKEINEHIINGGDMGSIATAFGKELDKSDFFRTLTATAKERNTASKSKKAEETAEK